MNKQTIKGYSYDEKEDEIGKGVFGTIFRARPIQGPSNEVAIKMIDHSKSRARTMPKELKEREVEICKAILDKHHENLVSVKDFEVKPNATYLVMEFCGGGDFRGYLEDKKTLSESVIQKFFRQIVSGLKFLHDQNIVHRDLKPENILFSFTGEVFIGNRYPTPENIILKIADFGISRFLSLEDVASTVCGTFVYMAPEILERKPYNKEVDVWSIGVMIHECLFGTIPKLPYKKSELPAKTSKEIRALLQKTMTQKPQDRLNCGQILEHEFMRSTIKELKNIDKTEGDSSFASKEDSTPSSKFGRWLGNTFIFKRSNDSRRTDTGTAYMSTLFNRNFVKNWNAAEGFANWTITQNGGNGFGNATHMNMHCDPIRSIAISDCSHCWVTSYWLCSKYQTIDLLAEGFTENILDRDKPTIEFSEWTASRYDCGSYYFVEVTLESDSMKALTNFKWSRNTKQWQTRSWIQVSHQFRNYPRGVRFVRVVHGGKDLQFWAGHYGPRITATSVMVKPE